MPGCAGQPWRNGPSLSRPVCVAKRALRSCFLLLLLHAGLWVSPSLTRPTSGWWAAVARQPLGAGFVAPGLERVTGMHSSDVGCAGAAAACCPCWGIASRPPPRLMPSGERVSATFQQSHFGQEARGGWKWTPGIRKWALPLRRTSMRLAGESSSPLFPGGSDFTGDADFTVDDEGPDVVSGDEGPRAKQGKVGDEFKIQLEDAAPRKSEAFADVEDSDDDMYMVRCALDVPFCTRLCLPLAGRLLYCWSVVLAGAPT